MIWVSDGSSTTRRSSEPAHLRSTTLHPLHAVNGRAWAGRVSRPHLQQRLELERDHEAQLLGRGRPFFQRENGRFAHWIMRIALQLCLVYTRGQRNARAIAIRHHDVRIAGLPRVFDGLTILHLSDLHLDGYPDITRVLIERVRTVDYDMAVVTGDIRSQTYGPYQPAMDVMHHVRSELKGPVYGVLGNHDTILMVPRLEAMGVRMLLNESIALERGGHTIYLAGIDDAHYYHTDDLDKAYEHIPADAIAILLSHSPEIYRQAAQVGFKVMFCGHTHGGQICLPGGVPLVRNARCPRRFCSGAWHYQQLQGYTSVGAGVSVVDVRLHCRPEITLHHLRAA